MCGDLVSNHGTTGRASIEREQRPGHPAPSSPSLGTMSVRWCGVGVPVQTNPTQPTGLRSPSPAPPRLNRPPSFALLLLLFHLLVLIFLRRLLLCSSSSSSFSTTLPPLTTAAAAGATTAAAVAVTPLPPSACHPLLPTAVLRFHLLLHLVLPHPSFGLPNHHLLLLSCPQATSAAATHTYVYAHVPARMPHPHRCRCRPYFSPRSPT